MSLFCSEMQTHDTCNTHTHTKQMLDEISDGEEDRRKAYANKNIIAYRDPTFCNLCNTRVIDQNVQFHHSLKTSDKKFQKVMHTECPQCHTTQSLCAECHYMLSTEFRDKNKQIKCAKCSHSLKFSQYAMSKCACKVLVCNKVSELILNDPHFESYYKSRNTSKELVTEMINGISEWCCESKYKYLVLSNEVDIRNQNNWNNVRGLMRVLPRFKHILSLKGANGYINANLNTFVSQFLRCLQTYRSKKYRKACLRVANRHCRLRTMDECSLMLFSTRN